MNSFNNYLGELFRGRSISNFLHLALNQGVNVLAALVITPILYQRLGESNFGLVNLALSVVMLLSVFVGYGYNLNGPKHLAIIKQSTEETSVYLNSILITRLLIAIFSILLFSALIFGFNLFDNYSLILFFSLIYLLGEALHPIIILQGLDRLLPLAIGNMLTKLLYVLCIYAFVFLPSDALWVNFILGGSTLLINISTLIYLSRVWGIQWNFERVSDFFKNLSSNFHFLLSTLASYVLVNGGFIVLSNFVEDEELGKYALSQRIALLLRSVPVFLSQSILQNASRLYQNDSDSFEKYLSRSYRNGLGVTALIGLLFLFVSDWVVFVLSGDQVPYSSDVLRVLSFLPFMGMLNIPNVIKILVADYKEVLSASLWLSTFFMLILSITGSSLYGGMGLAVGLLFSELITFIIHSIYLKKRSKGFDHLK